MGKPNNYRQQSCCAVCKFSNNEYVYTYYCLFDKTERPPYDDTQSLMENDAYFDWQDDHEVLTSCICDEYVPRIITEYSHEGE